MRLKLTPLAALVVGLSALPENASAEPPGHADGTRDRYGWWAHSETYAALFRRALLPGPNGSLVSTDTVAPIYEYASLGATDLDTALGKDSLDIELGLWSRALFGARDDEPLFDGDVQVANARVRRGPLSLRLGRQQVAGGAARFARFDGAELQVELGTGVTASAYGGWTVLPRWNELPQYAHLGAAADSLLRDSVTQAPAQRGKYWLTGGRVGWASAQRRLGLSFHEQREPGGLSRRNIGLDARAPLAASTTLGASALLDLERARFPDARVWLDARPSRFADLSFEYLHTEPALFLSHQSVLSVFGSAAYDEAGSLATLRAGRNLAFDGSGFAQMYAGERPGARAELAGRWGAGSPQRTFVRLAYARVLSPDNGYHSLRSSLSRTFSARVHGTLEAYAYLYDKAIRSYRASTVYATTLTFEPAPSLSLLWGASLAHSPYASLDAQTEVRVSYAFGPPTHRGGR
jgi:hypothetical protein